MRLFEDVRFALRILRRSPGFTAVAVLTLALGIGGSTALFSLVDQLLLKQLPVREPERLVSLFWSTPRFRDQSQFSMRDYEAFQGARHVLAQTAALRVFERLTVEQNGLPELASGEYVSGNYFKMLGVRPALGRLIEPLDDTTGAGGVVVISFGCWQRRFGSDPGVIGQAVRINSQPVTIIGVTPPQFHGLSPGYAPEFRLPLSARPVLQPVDERQRQVNPAFMVLGRLSPGVTLMQAEAYLRPLYAAREREKAQYLVESERNGFLARSAVLDVKDAGQGLYGLQSRYGRPLWILFAITGLALSAVCVNLAGLLLSRAERRQQETAIRVALGASRGCIVRQFLVESLLLSVFGSLLGCLLAAWASGLIVSFIPAGGYPRLVPIEVGKDVTARLLGFLAGVCALATLAFGLTPAALAARRGLSAALKSKAADSRHGRRLPLRNALLAGQVALSLFVVLGAVTLIGSLKSLVTEDPGYQREKLLMVTVDPAKGRYSQEQSHQFFDELLPRLRVLPGIESASLARYNPLGPTFAVAAMPISADGYKAGSDDDHPNSWPIRNAVTPGYFRVLRIRILSGREFSEKDDASSPRVAIINERFAQQYFRGQYPIGRRIGWNGRADIEVVGVSADVKYESLRDIAKPYWYIPYAQLKPDRWPQMTIQARVTVPIAEAAMGIRKEIAAVDSSVPLWQVTTMDAETDVHLSRERLVATISGFFGLLVALLVAIGTYGTASYGVTRRIKEIGIRLALGAEPRQIAQRVVADIVWVVALGIVVAIPLIWMCRTLLSSMVYGVAPTDIYIAILSISIVLAVALVATYGPARCAVSVDPIVTLREE